MCELLSSPTFFSFLFIYFYGGAHPVHFCLSLPTICFLNCTQSDIVWCFLYAIIWLFYVFMVLWFFIFFFLSFFVVLFCFLARFLLILWFIFILLLFVTLFIRLIPHRYEGPLLKCVMYFQCSHIWWWKESLWPVRGS